MFRHGGGHFLTRSLMPFRFTAFDSSATEALKCRSFMSTIFALMEAIMKLESNIRPISYIKTHAAEMLQQINDTQNPIVITQNGLAKGVLLDTRSYQEMIDAIGLLKVLSQGERDIESDDIVSHDEAIRSAIQAIEER